MRLSSATSSYSTVLLLALTMTSLPTRTTAWWLRGQSTNRKLEAGGVSLDLPGASINVGSGGVTVTTPWGSVSTGSGSTGDAPDSIGSLSCDTLTNYDPSSEPTCETALPDFYEGTKNFSTLKDKAKGRKAFMDGFCGTPCGEVYTNSLVADVLRCPAEEDDDNDDEQAEDDTTDDNDNDDDETSTTVTTTEDGGVNVNAPTTGVTTSPDGTVVVQAPGTTVNAGPGGVTVDAPTASINTNNGPLVTSTQTQTQSTKKPTKIAKTQDNNNDKAKINTQTQSTTTTTSTTKKATKPTFPSDYPGLRLGCVKDTKDNSYCAVKRAAVADSDVACDFYLSCCYAQYAQMFGDIPDSFADQVEEKCPGSKDFLNGDVCSQ